MQNGDDTSKDANFIMLQLVNALKVLQAQGVEELPQSLSCFVLCREMDKDTNNKLYVLQGYVCVWLLLLQIFSVYTSFSLKIIVCFCCIIQWSSTFNMNQGFLSIFASFSMLQDVTSYIKLFKSYFEAY